MTTLTKIATLSLLLATLTAAPASACQVATANISATGFGAEFTNNTCYVDIVVETVEFPIPQCKMSLKADQEIRVKTGLHKANCPLDEVRVNGQVMLVGGEYIFRGRIQ